MPNIDDLLAFFVETIIVLIHFDQMKTPKCYASVELYGSILTVFDKYLFQQSVRCNDSGQNGALILTVSELGVVYWY